MAEISKEQLNAVVSRALAEVRAEAQAGEAAFTVADLRTHLSELGVKGGAEVAWEISYKTSAAADIESFGRLGGEVAWEITYKTSASLDIEAPVTKPSAR